MGNYLVTLQPENHITRSEMHSCVLWEIQCKTKPTQSPAKALKTNGNSYKYNENHQILMKRKKYNTT